MPFQTEKANKKLRHLKNIMIDPCKFDEDLFIYIQKIKNHNFKITKENDK